MSNDLITSRNRTRYVNEAFKCAYFKRKMFLLIRQKTSQPTLYTQAIKKNDQDNETVIFRKELINSSMELHHN